LEETRFNGDEGHLDIEGDGAPKHQYC